MSVRRSNEPLGIVSLLELRGFDKSKPTKLVRHQDKRGDVNEWLRFGWLEFYQSTQGKPIFDHCEQIVSFVGAGKTRARFIGVYKVGKRLDIRSRQPPKGYPPELSSYRYLYDLERQPGYEDLENRIVIEWGENAISWHQWYNPRGKKPKDKEILEILPDGQTLPPFSDYLNFTLTHPELRELYKNEDANREWRASLAAVAGIYLVLATTTGEQYVGSAYGTKGIWGRWRDYAHNGHGENKLLKELIDKDNAYPEAFSYSVLQILPKSMKQKEVVRYEQNYKKKLGSVAKGLNASENRRSRKFE